jgi:hypothetical protein
MMCALARVRVHRSPHGSVGMEENVRSILNHERLHRLEIDDCVRSVGGSAGEAHRSSSQTKQYARDGSFATRTECYVKSRILVFSASS